VSRASRLRTVRSLAIVAGIFALVIGLMFYPFIHNYHVTPLARLGKRIQGADCAATADAFARYYQARRKAGSTDVQFADHSTDKDLAFRRLNPPRRLLHLYDLTLFDDVQLTAICDPAGARVEQVFYLGD
jgi:hypothetical protein